MPGSTLRGPSRLHSSSRISQWRARELNHGGSLQPFLIAFRARSTAAGRPRNTMASSDAAIHDGLRTVGVTVRHSHGEGLPGFATLWPYDYTLAIASLPGRPRPPNKLDAQVDRPSPRFAKSRLAARYPSTPQLESRDAPRISSRTTSAPWPRGAYRRRAHRGCQVLGAETGTGRRAARRHGRASGDRKSTFPRRRCGRLTTVRRRGDACVRSRHAYGDAWESRKCSPGCVPICRAR
jgi:hypothetical protein